MISKQKRVTYSPLCIYIYGHCACGRGNAKVDHVWCEERGRMALATVDANELTQPHSSEISALLWLCKWSALTQKGRAVLSQQDGELLLDLVYPDPHPLCAARLLMKRCLMACGNIFFLATHLPVGLAFLCSMAGQESRKQQGDQRGKELISRQCSCSLSSKSWWMPQIGEENQELDLRLLLVAWHYLSTLHPTDEWWHHGAWTCAWRLPSMLHWFSWV